MHGLRARGGFAVDLDWSDGKLTSAVLHSTGGTLARLRYGSITAPLKMAEGGQMRVTPSAEGELVLAPQ